MTISVIVFVIILVVLFVVCFERSYQNDDSEIDRTVIDKLSDHNDTSETIIEEVHDP